MGTEIERKFLVRDELWHPTAPGVLYRQGYLSTDPDRTVRVRLAAGMGYLTIKGRSVEASRAEFEYEIPSEDAAEMLDRLCLPGLVEKERYRVDHAGKTWEVDVFLGENEGLILAEVELAEARETIELPPWAGDEVTEDPRYYNAYLVAHPFGQW